MSQNVQRAFAVVSDVSAAAGSVGALATVKKPKSPNPIDVHVGSRIRLKRVSMGISQEKLGEAVGGITFQQIQKYEKGTNRVGASRLQAIGKALGEPASYFFEGAPDGSSSAEASVTTPGQEFARTAQGIKVNDSLAKLPEDLRRKAIALVHAMANAPDEA